jgi:hypothetical protein
LDSASARCARAASVGSSDSSPQAQNDRRGTGPEVRRSAGGVRPLRSRFRRR